MSTSITNSNSVETRSTKTDISNQTIHIIITHYFWYTSRIDILKCFPLKINFRELIFQCEKCSMQTKCRFSSMLYFSDNTLNIHFSSIRNTKKKFTFSTSSWLNLHSSCNPFDWVANYTDKTLVIKIHTQSGKNKNSQFFLLIFQNTLLHIILRSIWLLPGIVTNSVDATRTVPDKFMKFFVPNNLWRIGGNFFFLVLLTTYVFIVTWLLLSLV